MMNTSDPYTHSVIQPEQHAPKSKRRHSKHKAEVMAEELSGEQQLLANKGTYANPECNSISYWMDTVSFARRPMLEQNLEVDVAVVGAGILGLTCAYILTQNGKRVAVLEEKDLAQNQTARTTAHLTNMLDDRFYNLEKVFGEKGSKLAAQSHGAAIDFIENVVKKENIECLFERLDAYLFVPPNESVDQLHKEFEASKRAGMEVSTVSRAPIDYDTGMALRFGKQAQFSPLFYIDGIIKCIESRQPSSIFCRTRADKINGGDTVEVITDKGFTVKAKAAIVATNVPVNDRVLIHTKQAAYRSYVIVGRIPKGSVHKALYYDTLDPYHYVRLTLDPRTGEELLIIGGEDHKTGQEDDPDKRYDALEKWTRERFPTMQDVIYRWSGQIIEPVDYMGFIGENPMDKNVYIGTSDSGNGMTHGTLGAVLICDQIMGRDNAWVDLYDPGRISLRRVSEFITENGNTFWQYRDWVTSGDYSKPSQIPPNKGAVIRKGARKIACYKDEQGRITCMSAVCPHLQGLVRWNDSEKTWDCPCHGSRFGPTGKKINGPVNCDLPVFHELF